MKPSIAKFKDSWQLLYTGSAEEFVFSLYNEVQSHPAVHHEYLRRFSMGDLPNMEDALRDYAHQYSHYSSAFPAYVEGVLAALRPSFQQSLRENLEEELGDPNSEDPALLPHVELFRRFCVRAGVDEAYKQSHPYCTTVRVWRDLFLQKCRSTEEGVGLGGIGLGTECIVPIVYEYLYRGIVDHTSLSVDDAFFFKLHLECDTEHGNDIVQLCVELAQDLSLREAIRFGAVSSLNLRRAFWDTLLARATTRRAP